MLVGLLGANQQRRGMVAGGLKKERKKKENSAEEPSGMDDACLWCHGELKKEDPEARRRKLARCARTPF
jgi:hypothetical protein